MPQHVTSGPERDQWVDVGQCEIDRESRIFLAERLAGFAGKFFSADESAQREIRYAQAHRTAAGISL